MEHRHAEVLIAISNLKAVQYRARGGNTWMESTVCTDLNPITNYDLEWRVKPGPFAWLEEQDFYEVCQTYRQAHDGNRKSVSVCRAFEELKSFIRRNVEVIK